MTDLVVRKIAWDFDASVPFLWQPANPNFGIFCNAFTFIAVPFEKYIIGSLRQAQDRLAENPDVAAEAEAFLRQEAQHAAAHRKHMLALIERYPALEQCYQDTVDSYDDLIKSEPVEFHAAYIANLEATFTPLFKVFLDNRDALFGGGDRRVASLMVWHFVEEIEHRSSGSDPVPPPVAGSVVSRQAHPGDVPAHQRGGRRTSPRHSTNTPVRGSRRVGRESDVAGPAGRRVQVPRAGRTRRRRPTRWARPRCSTPCRPVIWRKWCGAWHFRRHRIMTRPSNPCPSGRTPGCGSTTGAPI